MVLGQNQDSPEKDFDSDQAFSGEMSQVGIWNRILTIAEIRGMARCELSLLVSLNT